jgi:quercetin dioxygenase-like cupin family protein
MKLPLAMVISVCVVSLNSSHARPQGATRVAHPAASPHDSHAIKITRNGSQKIIVGPPEHFTGSVHIQPLFDVNDPSRSVGASVTFDPGARTVWHVHPLGQTLIVTEGVGWIQQWSCPIQEIRKGDVVWIPAETKHWHGAAATTSMTHIAITEELNGEAVEWLEKVSDEEYRKR